MTTAEYQNASKAYDAARIAWRLALAKFCRDEIEAGSLEMCAREYVKECDTFDSALLKELYR